MKDPIAASKWSFNRVFNLYCSEGMLLLSLYQQAEAISMNINDAYILIIA